MLLTDPLSHFGQTLGIRYGLALPFGSEAPEVEQGLQRQVEIALALLVQTITGTHQIQHALGHGLAGTRWRTVELLDQRIIAIGGHLQIDLGEDRLGRGLEFGLRRDTFTEDVFDRIGAAHGRAAELFDPFRMQAAR